MAITKQRLQAPPPYRTGLAHTWSAAHRAEASRDIRSMALHAALTVTWNIGWALVGLSMTWS